MKRKKRWHIKQSIQFLTRTGGLLEQGYTISECIELFLKFENKDYKPLLKTIHQKLHNGQSVSEALQVLEIPKYILSFVYFSEQYGSLARGLKDSGELLKISYNHKEKFQRLMKYPLFLLWIVSMFLMIMYNHLFPQFQLLFASMNIPLPFITKIFLSFIENSHIFIIAIFIALLVSCSYYFVIFRRKEDYEKVKELCNIPIIGLYIKMVVTYFFSLNLSCLLASGMSIFDALAVFQMYEGKGYLPFGAKQLVMQLDNGERLDKALIESPIFLPPLAHVVDHGQANGRLDEELNHYSQWILQQLEQKVMRLMMIFQPLLFFIIGGVVLLMFSAILIPVFTLMNGLS